MGLLTKRFKKFLNLQKNGYGSKGDGFKKKTMFKNDEPNQEKSSREGIKYYG